MASIDTRPEFQPSEAQQEFALQAAEAMAAKFGVAMEDFEVVRIDEQEPNKDETEVKLKPGDKGYDGEPWESASDTQIPRFVVKYAEDKELILDPEDSSIMVGKWASSVQTYPPGSADGVPSIAIPIDM